MPPKIPYALIGNPIDHSPSPAMHNAAFTKLGMNAEYRLRPTKDEHELDAVLKELNFGKWAGINVTAPLKEAVGPRVSLEGHAKRAKAANTLWRYGAEIHGALTDVDGVLEPLKVRGVKEGSEALLIGGGGAARAAAIALDELGCRLHVATRNPDKARDFLDDIKVEKPGDSMTLSNQEALDAASSAANIIIQATPVGSQGERHKLDWSTVREGTIAFDMVYRPQETPFLADAKKAGCIIIEGWEMLLAQGAAALKIWTGRQPPVDAMREALLNGIN